MDILQAAQQICPGTAWNCVAGVLSQAEDGSPRVTAPSLSDLQAVMASDAYKDLRAAEYPSVLDLADAMVHQAAGDNAPMTAYVAKCEAVKAKYPKPS